jgi:RNA polymerase sigma-70 factor, ECF subfamily
MKAAVWADVERVLRDLGAGEHLGITAELNGMQSTARTDTRAHHSKAVKQTIGRNKMLSNFIPRIEETRADNVEFSGPVSDRALVEAAKNGDEGAIEALVRRYRRRLFAVALRYTRVREDAEDVVQQALHKAFVHLHNFEGKSTFSTWLMRITINEALMWLRRARALREVPIDDLSADEGTGAKFDIADGSADPEATYLQGEETRTLSMAIKRLAPNTRIVMELKELRELSARETARQMGLSLAAVKARVFHGRKKLRKHIAVVQNTRASRIAC